MPKAESNAGKRKANYKKNVFTQQWAEGRYTKSKGKGKADNDDDADEPKRAPLVYSTSIKAPGVLVNCVRGKEKKCGQELLEIFNSIADLLYPETKLDQSDDEGEEKAPVKAKTMEEELEADIEGMKKEKEKKVYRFSFVQTTVECFIYINVKQPIDPNRIIQHYLKSIEETGVTQTRFTLKVFPCQAVCGAELSKVIEATKGLVAQTAEEVKKEKGADYDVTWKINFNSKTDSGVSKEGVFAKASEISPLRVAMKEATLVVNIEMYKGIAIIGVLQDHDRFRKYNPQEVALTANKAKKSETGRVQAGKDETIPTEPVVAQPEVADATTVPPAEDAVDESTPAS